MDREIVFSLAECAANRVKYYMGALVDKLRSSNIILLVEGLDVANFWKRIDLLIRSTLS